MGSAEGGSGIDRWWESPSLTQADLRQYGESWSLAADAATATLLQSISQRLVSRTHEVEGALKKVLEETDSVMTSIANTNNSFHQLANTQFIENRTYQDDADVAREEPATQEKTQPTEEEVIARCRTAIAEGLALVNRSYERHEIQDSDSDDEDSPSSPLPVYALINPYEVKPLPHIIGTAMFMEDDRLGLQESSSEDNSKVTFSPEETDSEDDLDMEDETDINQKPKTIPATSSRLTDDSDSDWSDEEIPQPVRTQGHKPQPPHITSEEDDDDDDDEDFFGPSSKSFKRINNGPNLSSELNKKFQGTTATSQSVSGAGGVDSDSDEDGGLFGRRPDPPIPSSNAVPSSTATIPKTSSGVENVRAMPDPTRVRIPATVSQPKKSGGSNLFASDSDDDGDLFGSKPQSSDKSIGAVSKEPVAVRANSQTTPRASKQAKQPTSGGLFSSDGDDEDEGGLFGSKPAAASKSVVQKDSDEEGDREEPPPLPKANERKVPVGGINIFGSAITSAIRRQQSSDSEQSDDGGSDWGGSRKSSVSAPKIAKPVDKKEPPSVQTPAVAKAVAPPSGGGGSGLFDDEDEDDLFGNVVKKKPAASEEVKSSTKEEKSIPVAASAVSQKVAKRGLFSDDDDDDLFSISAKTEKPPSIAPSAPVNDKGKASSGSKALLSDPEEDALFNTKAPPKPSATQDKSKATNPIKVPAAPQKHSSLFSSPSDDDDLFSGPASSQPPPISSSKAPKKDTVDDLFGSPPSDSLVTDKKEVKGKDSHQSVKVESKAPPPTSIFTSLSDEDDLFATSRSQVEEASEPKSLSNKNTHASTSNSLHNSVAPKSDIFGSPGDDDLFGDAMKSEGKKASGSVVSQPKESKTESTNSIVNSIPKATVDGGQTLNTKTKKVSLFGSPEEDDIFSTVKPKINSDVLENKSSNIPKTNLFGGMSDDEDIFSTPPTPAKQTETSTTPRLVSDKEGSKTQSSLNDKEESKTKIDKETQEHNRKESTPPITKPPVGGVALFGGDELKAKISERNSIVNSVPEDTKTQAKIPTEDKTKKEKSDLSNQNLFDVESDEDDIFGIGRVPVERTSSHISGRDSPPPLPSEAKNASLLEKDSLPPVVPKDKLEKTPAVQKEEKSAEKTHKKEEKTKDEEPLLEDPKEAVKEEASDEVKPKKKLPIGGVSMFGGKGLGGSELFAKVNQRRSMLGGPEDESDGEDKEELTKAPSITQEDTKVSLPPPKTLASPTMPTLAALPGFGAKSSEAKSGGQESSISFDEPTSSNTLESINKSRVKGSIKRRPPSRAHRRSAVIDNVQIDGGTNPLVTEQPPSTLPTTNQQNSPVKVEEAAIESSSSSIPPPVDQIFSSSENEDDLFGKSPAKAANKTERLPVQDEKKDEVKSRSNSAFNPVGKAQTEEDDDNDLFRKPSSASSTAPSTVKAKSLSKPSSKPQAPSLFGEEDSDDEDLFGASKSRSSSLKTANAKPSGQQENPKKETKPPASNSLFGDDDDDIFSSAASVGKAETSIRKTSTSKPKTSLQPTSEPFDDPLLGPRK